MDRVKKDRRARRGGAAIALVALVGLSACGVEGVDVSVDAGLPPWLSACTTEVVESGPRPCIDQVVDRVEAEANALVRDGVATHAAFVAAYEPVADLLALVTGSAFSVSVDNPLDPAGNGTDPVTTTWTVGGEPVPVYACFEGATVVVDTTACAPG